MPNPRSIQRAAPHTYGMPRLSEPSFVNSLLTRTVVASAEGTIGTKHNGVNTLLPVNDYRLAARATKQRASHARGKNLAFCVCVCVCLCVFVCVFE